MRDRRMRGVLAALVASLGPLLADASGQLVCPPDMIVNAPSDACGERVYYPPPTMPSGFVPQGCDPETRSLFAGGTTTEVRCAAVDPRPPIAFFSCTFTVTVRDATAPVLTCPSPTRRRTDPGRCDALVEFAPSSRDQCPVTVQQIAGLPSGVAFPVGVTANFFVATDVGSNTDDCDFAIEVRDEEAPTLPCPEDIELAEPGVATYGAPATDNCDLAETTLEPPSGSSFGVGTTPVTASARDVSGNVASCTFDVTVVQGCALGATFASIGCRLAALGPLVTAAAPETVRGRLTRLLERTRSLVVQAEALATDGHVRPTRAALRRAIARVRRFRNKVEARKSGLDVASRASIGRQADTIAADLATLKGT